MKTIKTYITSIAIFSIMVLIPLTYIGCKKDDDGDELSLYEKLGERAGIESAVEQSILAISSDPELTPFFEVLLVDEGGMGAGLEALKENIADFVDENSGGNATYAGMSMAEAHSAANPRMTNAGEITDQVYNAFLDAMIQGAQQAGISDQSTLDEYRDLLDDSRDDIVN